MAHDQPLDAGFWLVEAIQYLGLVAAGVLGLRGGFPGALATGAICMALAVANPYLGLSALHNLLVPVFLVVGATHTLIAACHLRGAPRTPDVGGEPPDNQNAGQ